MGDEVDQELDAIDRLIAEDAANERAWAEDEDAHDTERAWAEDEDAPDTRSTSPVVERRSDALLGFTVGAKVWHIPFKIDAQVMQLAAAGDFMTGYAKQVFFGTVGRHDPITTL